MTAIDNNQDIQTYINNLKRQTLYVYAVGLTAIANAGYMFAGVKRIDMAARQGSYTDLGATFASASVPVAMFATYKLVTAMLKSAKTYEPIGGFLRTLAKPTAMDAFVAASTLAIGVPYANGVVSKNVQGRIEQAAIARRPVIDFYAPSDVIGRTVGEVYCREPGFLGAHYKGWKAARSAGTDYKVFCP
ncbi:MAG: hypothetical protein DI551_02855 [Micavibrio aeruginosavorus]|uniref:Uncharacterized protein n=1 Tax=Micavibrio aeruginosavorus TaxID=349221 RepID=A0A2W5N5Y5_9BACT|nr:MAG: hypothetical protein DI551_02855 [Micavibrio aeruginosavorus]